MNTGITGERRSKAAAMAGLSDKRRSCRNQTKTGAPLMPVRWPLKLGLAATRVKAISACGRSRGTSS